MKAFKMVLTHSSDNNDSTDKEVIFFSTNFKTKFYTECEMEVKNMMFSETKQKCFKAN